MAWETRSESSKGLSSLRQLGCSMPSQTLETFFCGRHEPVGCAERSRQLGSPLLSAVAPHQAQPGMATQLSQLLRPFRQRPVLRLPAGSGPSSSASASRAARRHPISATGATPTPRQPT